MGLFSTGGNAGRGPGRGGVRGWTGWGKSTGGVKRDRPVEKRTRGAWGKAERGPSRGWSRTGRSKYGPNR